MLLVAMKLLQGTANSSLRGVSIQEEWQGKIRIAKAGSGHEKFLQSIPCGDTFKGGGHRKPANSLQPTLQGGGGTWSIRLGKSGGQGIMLKCGSERFSYRGKPGNKLTVVAKLPQNNPQLLNSAGEEKRRNRCGLVSQCAEPQAGNPQAEMVSRLKASIALTLVQSQTNILKAGENSTDVGQMGMPRLRPNHNIIDIGEAETPSKRLSRESMLR